MSNFERIRGTVKENFELALKEEEVLNNLSPIDPYRNMAIVNIEYYLNCAAELERGVEITLTKLAINKMVVMEGRTK